MSSWEPAVFHDLTSLSLGNASWELGWEGSETKEQCPCVPSVLEDVSITSPGGCAPSNEGKSRNGVDPNGKRGSVESSVQGLPQVKLGTPAGHQVLPRGGVAKRRKQSTKRGGLGDDLITKCLSHRF